MPPPLAAKIMETVQFDIGQEVNIKLLDLPGYVTAIALRPYCQVNYEVSYFSKGEYRQIWFFEYELMPL